MSKKPASRMHFVMFDVTGLSDPTARFQLRYDKPAQAFLEERDRAIARKSGVPPKPGEQDSSIDHGATGKEVGVTPACIVIRVQPYLAGYQPR